MSCVRAARDGHHRVLHIDIGLFYADAGVFSVKHRFICGASFLQPQTAASISIYKTFCSGSVKTTSTRYNTTRADERGFLLNTSEFAWHVSNMNSPIGACSGLLLVLVSALWAVDGIQPPAPSAASTVASVSATASHWSASVTMTTTTLSPVRAMGGGGVSATTTRAGMFRSSLVLLCVLYIVYIHLSEVLGPKNALSEREREHQRESASNVMQCMRFWSLRRRTLDGLVSSTS